MITLRTLKWGNLFSYGDYNEVTLDTDTVTQILGTNGNGKSSIALILEEALYNKNSKNVKKNDIVNRESNSNSYWIKLYFSKDNDNYLVEVDRKSTIKVKLYKNDIDISSHTATNTFKQIEDIMEMDFKMFSQLINQNTSNSLQFLVATDTNRKKFLIDLLKLERYVKIFDTFKDAVKNQNNNLIKLQAQLEVVEKWLAQNSLEDTSLKEIKDIEALDTSEDEQKLAELRLEVSNIEATNRKISNNNKYKELLASIDINNLQTLDTVYINYDDKLATLGVLQSDMQRRNTYVKKISALDNKCPTCFQNIEESFKTEIIETEHSEIASLEQQIASISAEISIIKAGNSEHTNKMSKIKEWEDLFNTCDNSLPTELLNKKDLEDKVENISSRICSAKSKITAVIKENQEIAKHNSRVAVYLEQSNKYLQDLRVYKTNLSIESKNVQNLELLKNSFSTNGLLAYKIENLVKELEELTNEYLAELSDGRFTIEFTVLNDKLNVNITDNGKDVDILSLSSGELARVNTSTLLALRKLMNSISKSKINVLFLDEVISVLDDVGKEKLVEVLLLEDLNTYVISHGWRHPLLSKLEIVKQNNISRIERDG